MHLKTFAVTTLVGMMMSNVALAHIQNSQPTFNNNPSPEAVLSYWTPERLQNATPMDLPRVKPGSLKEISKNKMTNNLVEGDDGAPPTVNIAPDTHQLFKPINQQISNPSLDNGTLLEYFTSARLTPTNADTVYPYRTVGKLFFTTPSGDKTCSASVIRKRVLLTAGHCVHSGNGSQSGWFTNYLFIPAYNNGTAPYQSWTTSFSTVMSDWYNGGGKVPNKMDFGFLEVVDKTINDTLQPIGNITGFLGWQTDSTIPNHAHIIGYSNNFDSGNLMHQVTAQSAKAVDANNVEYGSDMSVGAGGSPWIQNFGDPATGQTGGTNAGRNRIVGTSAYAYSDPAALVNGGSIFDHWFVNLLNFICNHKAGNC